MIYQIKKDNEGYYIGSFDFERLTYSVPIEIVYGQLFNAIKEARSRNIKIDFEFQI